MIKEETYPSVLDNVYQAARRLKNVVVRTPLAINNNLSGIYGAKISFKREDLQQVRSYKIRGAYNKMAVMSLKILRKAWFVPVQETMPREWLLPAIP
ncbi:threonine dehydratase [Chryseobacterium oranimense G311]|nr:threonine dehydratase [Chryseobacterium oranimense G311]